MSLFFYGGCILGVVLAGLVLLVIFSLLAMAQKGDECLEQLELEMLKPPQYVPPLIKTEKSENTCVPANSALYNVGATKSGSYPR